ncbi:hypothetical protein [uncultured Gordonia sp.]|uniref:hypothetical protein n=1 Tax=uncultured Gordonia sp. TaxID=198437 RepID=UPI00258B15C2|nr:hypothetical protein [uncultured Gordonia sp.]
MRIAHPRRNYSGVEIHQARRLEFVDGVAETDDSTALAAALSVKGYRRVSDPEVAEAFVSLKDEQPKRKRGKAVDHSLEDDVTVDPADVERTYDD